MTATIEWKDARVEVPDDSETVICGFEDGVTEHGFWDSESEQWRSLEGHVYPNSDVEFWARCLEVPTRNP